MAYHFSPNVNTNGLVLYLDGANPKSYLSGSLSWNDLSTYQCTSSLFNGVSYTDSGCFRFDGVNDYIQVDERNNIYGSKEVTLEVVHKINSNTSTSINGGTAQYIFFRQNTRVSGFESFCYAYLPSGTTSGSLLSVCTSSGGTQKIISSSYSNFLNTSIYATCTYTSASLKFYINGQIISSASTGFNLDYNTINKSSIGRANASGNTFDKYYNGDIYLVRVYNKELTDSEILQNYNATKARYGL